MDNKVNITKTQDQHNMAFKAVLDTILDGVIKVTDGGIDIFNSSAQNLFGYSEQEVLGKNINILMPDGVSKNYDKYLQDKKSPTGSRVIEKNREVLAKRKDGTKFSLEVTINHNKVGDKEFFVFIVRDITETKKSEERLNQYIDRMEWAYFEMQHARSEAMSANQSKSVFLANMSHEIRTPLNGILGMTELLLNTNQTEKQKKYAKNIYSSGEMLLELINDILDYSKIEAGGMRLESRPCNLRKEVKTIQKILSSKVMEKGLDFRVNITQDVPQKIIADPVRIKQILLNIIGNAVKFTEKGCVEVSIKVLANLKEKVKLRFEIKDTGIGVESAKQTKIFNKFEQADLTTTRKFGGTGLGLAICKQLVEDLMKGHIGMESIPEKGSLFWFELTLPLKKKEA